jgi:hypothetical protein
MFFRFSTCLCFSRRTGKFANIHSVNDILRLAEVTVFVTGMEISTYSKMAYGQGSLCPSGFSCLPTDAE